jgi:hypothetical protein
MEISTPFADSFDKMLSAHSLSTVVTLNPTRVHATLLDTLRDDVVCSVLQLLSPRDILATSVASKRMRKFVMASENAAIWRFALLEPPRPNESVSKRGDLHRRACYALAINHRGNDTVRVAALRASLNHMWAMSRLFGA